MKVNMYYRVKSVCEKVPRLAFNAKQILKEKKILHKISQIQNKPSFASEKEIPMKKVFEIEIFRQVLTT